MSTHAHTQTHTYGRDGVKFSTLGERARANITVWGNIVGPTLDIDSE